MNKLEQLFAAIECVLAKNESMEYVTKILFNKQLKQERLEELILREYQISGLSLNEYIDYLLYRIDSQVDIDLILEYTINDRIMEEITNQTPLLKDTPIQDQKIQTQRQRL